VPILVGSISGITFVAAKPVTVEEVNNALIEAAKSEKYKGILTVTNEQIVSSDIVGTSASSIVDLSLTQIVDGDLVKIVAWYDNEWGYSNRLVEMAVKIAKQITNEPVKEKTEEPIKTTIEEPILTKPAFVIKTAGEETEEIKTPTPVAVKTAEDKTEEIKTLTFAASGAKTEE
jgi:hypothetical protein